MLTAYNGILIVALTMALGLHWNDRFLIFMAFAMAGLSYVVNVLDESQITFGRDLLFWLAFGLGALTYAYALFKLLGA